MSYTFKKFERDFTQGAAEISISRDSTIRFSAKFCKITDILKFDYVIFFFDTAKHAIGMLPTNQRDRGSFKITKEKFNATVSATSFLRANEINPKLYQGRYEWIKESIPGIGEIYIVPLNVKMKQLIKGEFNFKSKLSNLFHKEVSDSYNQKNEYNFHGPVTFVQKGIKKSKNMRNKKLILLP